MFPLILFLVSLSALIYATYSDLRWRIIPNKLTYALIGGGLALQAVYAYTAGNPMQFIIAAGVTALAFAGSYGLWKLGVWAGGDVKLMTGLAALNPVNHAALAGFLGFTGGLFAPVSLPLFPLSLFLFSVLSMAPYAVLISVNALARRADLRAELFGVFKTRALQALGAGIAVSGVSAVLNYLSLPGMLLLPVMLVLALLKGAGRYVLLALAFIFALSQDAFGALQYAAVVAAGLFVIYTILKLVSISRSKVLKETMKITKLEEGDIVSETIVLRAGKAMRVPGFAMQKVINYIRSNRLAELLAELRPEGKVLASPRKAAGIGEDEINELRRLVKEGKLEDRIIVSRSAPFVPAVLIGYVALQIIGDLLWNVLF